MLSIETNCSRKEQRLESTAAVCPDFKRERYTHNISGHSPWFSAVEIIVVDPFLVAGHIAMQKPLMILSLKKMFTNKKRCPTSLDFNLYGTQSPCFWLIPMALRRFEMTCWVTPNDSANSSCVCQESSASNASNSESSKIFFFPPPCRSST